jgi:hypothetical protein
MKVEILLEMFPEELTPLLVGQEFNLGGEFLDLLGKVFAVLCDNACARFTKVALMNSSVLRDWTWSKMIATSLVM